MSTSLADVDAVTVVVQTHQKSLVLHRCVQVLDKNYDSCERMDSKSSTKTSKDSCPATPSTRAPSSLSSEDSLISTQTPQGQDVASLQAQTIKANALSTKSDQEVEELIELRDQLARFRNDKDVSKEAVKQTFFVIEELSKKDVTVEILRKTGLGLECSKQFLLKHPCTDVSRASRELVARWKGLQARMIKADAQKMEELITIRDQLARFRNDEDNSEEAIKQTLFVIGELSNKDITIKSLRKTGLGLECSKQFLLNHSSTEVSRASRELVACWKALANTGALRQTSTPKSSWACEAIESSKTVEPEIVEPEYLVMSRPGWDPKLEPESANHIKDQLKQKDTQIARLQATIKRRQSLDGVTESENQIIKHYEEVLDSLQKEAQELRHRVGEV
jgi:hypothetical protein